MESSRGSGVLTSLDFAGGSRRAERGCSDLAERCSAPSGMHTFDEPRLGCSSRARGILTGLESVGV